MVLFYYCGYSIANLQIVYLYQYFTMEQAVDEYLKYLNIPVSERYCKKRIASHPDYPSLLAVADTLQQLGIPHIVARADKETVSDLPLPVLLHLNTAGGKLLPMYKTKDLEDSREKLGYWSGVLIKAEPAKQIADKENYKALEEEKRFKLLAAIIMLAAAGLVTFPLFVSFSWLQLILLTTAITGVVTGYFLFAKDLGITYRAVESFCNAGTGAGCGKVLRSEDGKLFGFITFSDLTLGYFTSQLIAAGLIVPLWAGSTVLTFLGWVSILAVPMIAYSLWQQAYKIKEWCRLCLVVSGVLAIQAIFFGYLFYDGLLNPLAVSLPEAVITLLLFGLAGSLLLLLKQVLQEKNQAVQNEIAAARIKNSPDVFKSLLFKQRQVDVAPFKNDFMIGSPDAPIQLTMAVNLYCGHCKTELEQAKDLLNTYPDQVNLSLRFLKSGDDGKTSRVLLKSWLQQSGEQSNGVPNGQTLIDKWYGVMDADKFKESHAVNGVVSDTETEEYLQTHYSWVKSSGITKTPTTFVNGFELPAAYRLKDLVSLIPGLLEDFISQKEFNKNEESVHSARISEK